MQFVLAHRAAAQSKICCFPSVSLLGTSAVPLPGSPLVYVSPSLIQVYFEEKSYHVLPYGSSWTEDGTRIAVHVDMNLRTCSFEVNGQHFGQAFYDLPAEVYPAVSMRDGGRIKFAACLQAQ